MICFVGLDVSQKITAIWVVDNAAAEYDGVSDSQFRNKSAFWSAGMREMTLA
jgi:hypothetical protein